MRDANLIPPTTSQASKQRRSSLPVVLSAVAVVALVGTYVANPQTPEETALTGLFIFLMAIITAGCCAYRIGEGL